MIRARAIAPHAPLNTSVFRKNFRAAGLEVGEGMEKDFKRTTRTWKEPVEFKVTVRNYSEGIRVFVSTGNKIYGYVDEGTRPHIIRPKKAGGRLAFKSRYKSKTTPHVIGSHQGGSSGKTIFSRVVHHPGTEAREFSTDIQAKWQPKLKAIVEEALRRAAREAGLK